MKPINYLRSLFLLLSVAYFLTACEKDDVRSPEILSFELGDENGKNAYPGGELHMIANVGADSDIDHIEININYSIRNSNNISLDDYDNEWNLNLTLTEFSGLKNTNIHKAIEIPGNAKPGRYNFHLKVVDTNGSYAQTEEIFEILIPDITEPPVITITKSPEDGQLFMKGYTINIAGTVSHAIAVEELYIGLVRGNSDLTDAQINSNNSITILKQTEFDDPRHVDFDARIITGTDYDNDLLPKEITGDLEWLDMEYFIIIKAKAAFNGPYEFSQRFAIDIGGCECDA